MKKFLIKTGIISAVCLLFLAIGLISLKSILESSFEYQDFLERSRENDKKYISDFHRHGGIVANGENGMSVTPVDAYIESGILYVKTEIHNDTGSNLKLNNFGYVSGDFTTTIYSTDYENGITLKNNDSLEVLFSVGAYDIMTPPNNYPNTINFTIDAYNNSNNLQKYDITIRPSWLYNRTENY